MDHRAPCQLLRSLYLKHKRQTGVGTTGHQPQTPDRSGQYRTSTSNIQPQTQQQSQSHNYSHTITITNTQPKHTKTQPHTQPQTHKPQTKPQTQPQTDNHKHNQKHKHNHKQITNTIKTHKHTITNTQPQTHNHKHNHTIAESTGWFIDTPDPFRGAGLETFLICSFTLLREKLVVRSIGEKSRDVTCCSPQSTPNLANLLWRTLDFLASLHPKSVQYETCKTSSSSSPGRKISTPTPRSPV